MPKRYRSQAIYHRKPRQRRHSGELAGSRADPLDILRATIDQLPRATSLDDLLERTITSLHDRMGNSVTAIMQLLPDSATLYARSFLSSQPYGGSLMLSIHKGLVGAAASARQTVVANDVSTDQRHVPAEGWDTRSELCVPIITHHGLWGILNLESERANAFPQRVVKIAEIVAQQLAIAVENTALIDQAHEQTLLLERRARELAQVLDLNNHLRVSMDLNTLLQHQADAIGRIMGFQSVVVNLVDVELNHVWVAATFGCTPEEQALLRDATYRWDTFFGDNPEQFQVSRSYFIPAEANFNVPGVYIKANVDGRAAHEWQAEDMLMIPIANHRGEIFGIFSVDDPIDRQRPSLATIQGLEIFAAHAAAAIENVRLFAQSNAALEALKQSNDQQARLLDTVQRTQAELINASKLAAVGTLAAGVAHEFNNLLAGMHGYAELGQLGALEEKDEALEIIRRTCQRGVQITRRLLTFARQTDGARDLTQIDEIADGALQLISWDLARAQIAVVRDYRSNTAVWTESGQIMQVVLNLLSNARDATPPGGSVTVTTRDNQDWVEIAVADTGSGIAETIRDRIFEPFVTTKGALGGSAVAGTGLGLSVSYGIVQAHDGRLLVESASGKGSTFTIQLPRHFEILPAAPPAASPATPPAAPALPLHILVVDDEAPVRTVVAQILTRAGHIVAQASDGLDALSRSDSERWDLIISDVTMPGLDGPNLIGQLRARGITTPAILMTGRVDGGGLGQDQSSDMITVMAKPFDRAKLLATIGSAVGRESERLRVKD
jgi:signal transduction histidine kinase/putative methionine-R-sulfoxide reductase with GAF domain/ActR/RegA family two-component response regulator